ncbi:MAG: MMPL family transporter [Hahellaceae bacterium]|nr:MMPL family transporter [Hahellaceae bacterium]
MQILPRLAVRYPRAGFWLSGTLSLLLIVLVALPFLVPSSSRFLPTLTIDTDPENMLRDDEPVRVLHNEMKRTFALNDMVVVGVVNKTHPQGVFNPQTLRDIYDLTEFARTLQWEREGGQDGVVSIDLIAPSTVDHIQQEGLGSVRFEWLMAAPPQTAREAADIAARALRIPFLKDTLVSSDQRALALYLPITSKDISFKVAEALREHVAYYYHGDEYHITGLPIAQDQFGVDMFKQMAISAPLAMALIFVLMWSFFRNVRLVSAPMIVALVSVILTMGLLVLSGHTIHIMSSMIPIFVMPIAVLDAVHILSDFFDRYPHSRDRARTLDAVMTELNAPMLYTTITTCAGFASLAFTPIPPVQVFGLFVALGVAFAWLLTVTLIPAYIMLMPEASLSQFGRQQANRHTQDRDGKSLMDRLLTGLGGLTRRFARSILLLFAGLGILSAWGISQIQINDNPVKWFAEDHPIRVADRELNARFGGTYMAYLTLAAAQDLSVDTTRQSLVNTANDLPAALATPLQQWLTSSSQNDRKALLEATRAYVSQAMKTSNDDDWEAWDTYLVAVSEIEQQSEVFKRPDVLAYIEGLQTFLSQSTQVGKSNGLPDIVKTVHRELFLGDEKAYRLPDSVNAVGQTLVTYQSSHRPQDLWHFVTPDFRRTTLWLQLKSGDNTDMKAIVDLTKRYLAEHPAPVALSHDWFGLTYINVIWQDKMVSGMLEAFLGSFVIVLGMMIVLFRSFWWGLLSMLPLTITIGAIYGVIGFIGKDYDMPVAVLSALSLGLAVDYAIHFLARARFQVAQAGSWDRAADPMFGEPARAITRNVIVIGVGFLPLLAAPLIPYQTVGVFISSILLLAGVVSLTLLPALFHVFAKTLFKSRSH